MIDTDTKPTDALSFAPTEAKAPQPSIAAPVPTRRREGTRIHLVGEIGPKSPVSLASVRELVLRQPEETPKTIVLNSSGGNLDEGFRIFEFLHALPIPMSTVAEKYCRSSALIIFLAGNFRIANPGTEFLLHPTNMSADDLPQCLNARTLQRHADNMKAGDDRILNLLEARTGFDRSAFEVEMSNELPMSESFAIDSGIVHEWPGLNRCYPNWSDAVRQMQAAEMILPPRLTSPNYLAACREADAHFSVVE